ncbi:hypothetical protein [Lactobacillus rizhaonensis]|uniref:hypothetical protein n=1 Tax=Lactobacillus rizhaonensis TaxID=3082863 RepID=UPI0025FCD869|nr:hypothetical protein [uncultured Lactobacillus sp.]
MKRELYKEVKEAWHGIQETYIPKSVATNLARFNDVGEGVEFIFELTHAYAHHFQVKVRLSQSILFLGDEISLRKHMLHEVGKRIIYQIGDYQIDEAYDPEFCSNNHYSRMDLDYLHEDEDMLLEVAQAMIVGAKFDDYDQNLDADFGLLKPFSSNQIALIKTIYKILVEKFGLEAETIVFSGFLDSMNQKSYQIATLSFKKSGGLKPITVDVFSNLVWQYSYKYAERGMGEDQAIYFIIRTFLSRYVAEFDPTLIVSTSKEELAATKLPQLKQDKAALTGIVVSLPKFYRQLF